MQIVVRVIIIYIIDCKMRSSSQKLVSAPPLFELLVESVKNICVAPQFCQLDDGQGTHRDAGVSSLIVSTQEDVGSLD